MDCPDLCPCNPADILDFGNAVNMGFSQAFQSNSCKVCFSPIALSDCETVEWYLNNTTSTTIGSSNGNQAFCHTFPGAGSYNVIMVVNRKRPDGSDCETFTYSRPVNVFCGIWPDCGGPKIINPNFSINAIPGGLNSGRNISRLDWSSWKSRSHC